jgi:hypothetical protein|tara:strand:+ start:10763 stop:11197 length:435 start_codon:yes stop_codon:yes gene_type:complete
MNDKTLQDILNSSMPSLKMRMPENNIETNANYAGADKVDELINLVNYLSSLQTGKFGQQYKELGIYDMPESGRRSEAFLKRMPDEDLQRYYDDEEKEMSTKASIILDMFKRGQYNYKLGGTNVPLLREDYLKTDVRKVFGDKSK